MHRRVIWLLIVVTLAGAAIAADRALNRASLPDDAALVERFASMVASEAKETPIEALGRARVYNRLQREAYVCGRYRYGSVRDVKFAIQFRLLAQEVRMYEIEHKRRLWRSSRSIGWTTYEDLSDDVLARAPAGRDIPIR